MIDITENIQFLCIFNRLCVGKNSKGKKVIFRPQESKFEIHVQVKDLPTKSIHGLHQKMIHFLLANLIFARKMGESSSLMILYFDCELFILNEVL